MAAGGEGDAALIEVLLGDIKGIFVERAADRIPSADLVAALVAIEGRPWAEMGKARKPLTANRLARMLKSLGVAPDTFKIGDKAHSCEVSGTASEGSQGKCQGRFDAIRVS